jgi:EpsI family protein
MLAAAGLALALTPRQYLIEEAHKFNLEGMIPAQFGEWKIDKAVLPTIHSPDVQANLDRTYDQLLDRTYINRKGQRIMLMIAQVNAQSSSKQIHRPEVCYPALGFGIGPLSKGYIHTGGMRLPVMKLVASRGSRTEPITYWVMIGNSAVRGRFEQFFARLKYGLTGKIPYGILIRVSTISAGELQSHRTEDLFVLDMLRAMPMEYRRILTGPGQ